MYRNYELLKGSRNTVNNNIAKYKFLGNSLRIIILQSRRYRAI